MLKKIKNIFFFLSINGLIFLSINYYFSEKNIIHINKIRSSYSLTLNNNLPLLRDDTSNIITYKNDLDEYKKSLKKRFWEELISNDK